MPSNSGLPLNGASSRGDAGLVHANDVDRAIRLEALTRPRHASSRAARGSPCKRIVGGGQLLSEQQVVQGHLGGNVYPLGAPQCHDRASGREVAHVQAR